MQTGAAHGQAVSRVRVLIVEDEGPIASALAKAIRRVLRGLELEVDTAGSPEEALASLDRSPPSDDPLLVISDYNLQSSRNGIQLLNEISTRYPSSRRILMSGYERSTFARELPGARLDAVLSKPLDIDELGQLATSLLRPRGE